MHPQVQPHLKKCFDNIKSLDMVRVHQHMEATHMNSSDREKVELKQAVRLEGVVEGWLCEIEDMMKMTLKDSLRACRVDLKKNLSKREKWVRDWPGQMLITASQIQWTADCEKALDRGDKKGLKSLRKKQVRIQCGLGLLETDSATVHVHTIHLNFLSYTGNSFLLPFYLFCFNFTLFNACFHFH